MGSKGAAVRMSVRILDETGGEIASFFSDTPEGDEGGFSAALQDALLAFRKKYPNTRFIDVEFKGGGIEAPEAPKGGKRPADMIGTPVISEVCAAPGSALPACL
jgi:hypothetical protein